MPKTKTRTQKPAGKLPASWQVELTDFLIDTAYRSPRLEATVLKIADLADLPAVRAEITRLRKYAARRNGRKVA